MQAAYEEEEEEEDDDYHDHEEQDQDEWKREDPLAVALGGGKRQRKNVHKRLIQSIRYTPAVVSSNSSASGQSIAAFSLVSLCRNTICAHLERYDASSFMILTEDEWDAIITLRHCMTAPKEGSGGLDGTGRRTPAISDKFMRSVEEACPAFAESTIADQLIWKDCVEYRFRRSGLTRPKGLYWPWPLLLQEIQKMMDRVEAGSDPEAEQWLMESPMNVALLQASGVGKQMKKIIKARKKSNGDTSVLEKTFDCWKAIAANSGVQIHGAVAAVEKGEDEDLQHAEKCQTWRQLFEVLKHKEEERRSDQGKRMREIRKNLASGRPKIVKVRPASAKYERILSRPMEKASGLKPPPGNGKISQLRKEASVMASRQRANPSNMERKPSFGAAVAFAQPKNRKPSDKAKTSVSVLAGGKRMAVPTKVVQGAGPRQLASKWKKLSK